MMGLEDVFPASNMALTILGSQPLATQRDSINCKKSPALGPTGHPYLPIHLEVCR